MGVNFDGRDINGMRAAPWAAPDLGAIQSVKVKPKCSNAELLDAIKTVISESVTILRADNTDDKYINIVDMLMMRVRGSLAMLAEHLDTALEPLATFNSEQFISNITNNVVAMFEEKMSSGDLYVMNSSSLNELVNNIISTISTSLKDIAANQTKAAPAEKAASSEKPENKPAEQTQAVDTKAIAEQPIEQIAPEPVDNTAANDMMLRIIENQQEILNNISILQIVLNDSFSRLESLVMAQNIQLEKPTQNDNALQSLEKSISDNITNAQKSIEVTKSKIDEKMDAPESTKQIVAEKPAQNNDKKANDAPKKAQNVFTNKQFREFIKLIQQTNASVNKNIDAARDAIYNNFQIILKHLEKMNESFNKGKISLVGILAIVSLVLLPLFKDKILELFAWLNKTFSIDTIIEKALKSVNWGKHIGTILSLIWGLIKTAFSTLLESPLKWAKKVFTEMYTNVTKWGSDVWGWVKEKLGFTQKTQDENEIRAEQNAIAAVDTGINNLNEKTAEQNKLIEEECNTAVVNISDEVRNSSDAISASVGELRDNTGEDVREMTNIVNESQLQIADQANTANKNLEETVNTARQNIDDRTDAEISKAEDKVNKQMDDLEADLKAEGPPAVSTKTIQKLQSEASEGDALNAKPGEKREAGDYQTKNVINSEGQIESLTASAEEIKKAEEANGKLADVSSSFGGPPDKDITPSDKTTANISNKIIVNTNNNALNQTLSLENAGQAIDAVVHNSALINDGLKTGFKVLEAIESKISDYFGEINGVVNAIKNRPPAQKNAVVISTSSSGGSHNSASMDEM